MKFLIRADGSTAIGTGHILRTFSLAQVLKSLNHRITYVCRELSPGLKRRLETTGLDVIGIPHSLRGKSETNLLVTILSQKKPDWLIVDHYGVKESDYLQFRKTGVKILAIDDINHTKFPVDILLNQNIDATNYTYRCREDTLQLLGPGYALVSETYCRQRPRAAVRKNYRRLLVSMGGADRYNATFKVLQGIELTKKDFSVDVILGAAYPFTKEIKQFVTPLPNKYRIYHDLPRLTERILRADLAIGAGGSTCWEMCTLFLPMVIIPIADNQLGIAKGLTELRAAIYPGRAQDIHAKDIARILDSLSPSSISKMSQNSGAICDGRGIQRLLPHLFQNHPAPLASPKIKKINLREVGPTDSALLFRWINDPDVRRNSLNSDPIDLKTHQKWFDSKLAHPEKTRIFIAGFPSGQPVGQIRFDREGKKILISYSVDSLFRGRDIGHLLIKKAEGIICPIWKNTKILAGVIKPQNLASKRIFEKNDFVLVKKNPILEYNKTIKPPSKTYALSHHSNR